MENYTYSQTVERWGTFEVSVTGNSDGNPFTDYFIFGTFKSKNETKRVDGFYDGGGVYRVRFMPSFVEDYTFSLESNFFEKAYQGSFSVLPAKEKNHGPVRVADTYHFAYEDGTPYYCVGTTCYVFTMQEEWIREKTLDTLKNSPFNKIRFCVFPKHYDYNLGEPVTYPYVGTPMDSSVLTKENFMEYHGCAKGNDWDYKRFSPEHFQILEENICKLMELGIEADLIMMHPYDRWGFSEMTKECDDLYFKYVIARFSAYRNIWWSLANEYDLMTKKTLEDWERYAAIICEKDAYGHLRSIHNCRPFYDYTRPWITHCSMQRQDVYKSAELTEEWRVRYKKPIVLDEIAYEGNLSHGWGNISAKELVRRFWEASCRGGYAGHGETYIHEKDIIWWSHGGMLHGESPERISFLYDLLKETPGIGLTPMQTAWDEVAACAENNTGYYIYYYGFNRPSFRKFYFDDEKEYEVEVIDTWEMTITKLGNKKGKFQVELPGKEYMAVRIKVCDDKIAN